jgi:hypothetical protein
VSAGNFAAKPNFAIVAEGVAAAFGVEASADGPPSSKLEALGFFLHDVKDSAASSSNDTERRDEKRMESGTVGAKPSLVNPAFAGIQSAYFFTGARP